MTTFFIKYFFKKLSRKEIQIQNPTQIPSCVSRKKEKRQRGVVNKSRWRRRWVWTDRSYYDSLGR